MIFVICLKIRLIKESESERTCIKHIWNDQKYFQTSVKHIRRKFNIPSMQNLLKNQNSFKNIKEIVGFNKLLIIPLRKTSITNKTNYPWVNQNLKGSTELYV